MSNNAEKTGFGASLARSRTNERKSLEERFSKVESIADSLEENIMTPPRKNFKVIDLLSLRPNPYNARFFYDMEKINNFALELKTEGQKVPIIITNNPDEEGTYIVIDGHRRLKAASVNGDSTIKCEYIENVTGFELYKISNSVNTERAAQTVFDDAISWKKLIDDGLVRSQSELIDKVNKPKSYISKVLALNEIPQDLSEILAYANIPLSTAYAFFLIKDIYDDKKLKKIASEVADGEIGRNTLDRLKKASLTSNQESKENPEKKEDLVIKNEEGKCLANVKFTKNKILINIEPTAQLDRVRFEAEIQNLILSIKDPLASEEI